MLYIRQSSAYPVNHNLETQKLQCAMEERLRQLIRLAFGLFKKSRPDRLPGPSPAPALNVWWQSNAPRTCIRALP